MTLPSLPPADGVHRPIRLMIDSSSWLEAHRDPAGGWRVERHKPKREASVGYVDRPLVARAASVADATIAVFVDNELDGIYPVAVLAVELEARVRAKTAPEPEL